MPTAAQLHNELWTSLASLLRSYTAVHGLHKGRQATTQANEERITVCHGARRLELRRTGATIAWTRENGESGTLELMETGRLRGASGEEEMDLAAEAWARELML